MLDATTENDSALFYLGEYFQNDILIGRLQTFFWKDLHPFNLLTYYKHAKALLQEESLKPIAEFCQRWHLWESSEHLERLPLEFWLDTLPLVNTSSDNKDHVSKLAELLCRKV